jgi:8-oxo-dGDP phosphatase
MATPRYNLPGWILHTERTIYESRSVRLGLADVSLPSGERFEHHTVTAPAAAITVALDDTSARVLMAWRHRFVPDVWNWELPAGLIEPGETPEGAAVRELEEETGYHAHNIEHLVTFEPMIGTARSPHHVFAARNVRKAGEPTELNEGVFEWVELSAVPDLVRRGHILSSGSLIGLLHVLAF